MLEQRSPLRAYQAKPSQLATVIMVVLGNFWEL
jgi:hypothetical protein